MQLRSCCEAPLALAEDIVWFARRWRWRHDRRDGGQVGQACALGGHGQLVGGDDCLVLAERAGPRLAVGPSASLGVDGGLELGLALGAMFGAIDDWPFLARRRVGWRVIGSGPW